VISVPPFCPNPSCSMHSHSAIRNDPATRWFHRDGHYHSRIGGSIQRFRCTRCRTRFSSQTFSLDYAVKRKLPYKRIFQQLNSGSGVRQLARHLNVSEKVIINRAGRLARQSIALHSRLRPLLALSEHLCADGFESFTVSQYYPNNIHLLIGKRSQYFYGADYAHIRRKGRMSEYQKRRRRKLETVFRPSPQELSRSFERLMHQMLLYLHHRPPQVLRLYTDENQVYRQVISRGQQLRALLNHRLFVHETRSSRLPRTTANDLFAVNYYDREVRKDQANHVRETVQFSRNVNNSMERLWIYAAYHNYSKPYRIRERSSRTHAVAAGLSPRTIASSMKSFFTQRSLYSHLTLSVSEWFLWFRCYPTPWKRYAEQCPAYTFG
jgi:transposase-like protein